MWFGFDSCHFRKRKIGKRNAKVQHERGPMMGLTPPGSFLGFTYPCAVFSQYIVHIHSRLDKIQQALLTPRSLCEENQVHWQKRCSLHPCTVTFPFLLTTSFSCFYLQNLFQCLFFICSQIIGPKQILPHQPKEPKFVFFHLLFKLREI